ncbi:unnamed protein product [Lactuca saligna]|uniref:Uncharacterized protein n=1 Tax=Lactuca saligna TaxID=75948 RepID=A0AA35ZD00_LACSI|nr:unnamed protein product [Lactuca saligna]
MHEFDKGDPPGLDKGDPTKHHSYETIEASVYNGVMHEFAKVPKKSFDIKNTDFNQLDFLINKMMFISAQYQIVDNFEDKEEEAGLVYAISNIPSPINCTSAFILPFPDSYPSFASSSLSATQSQNYVSLIYCNMEEQ